MCFSGKRALAIALVFIADMIVLSRINALRGSYYVDENQELIALGIANVATGVFQGFSVSRSVSRTLVAESAGARTQLTCVVVALCVALLLLFAPGLMMNVPIAALAAVVFTVCFKLVESMEVRGLYCPRRGVFVLSIVCFLGVALLGGRTRYIHFSRFFPAGLHLACLTPLMCRTGAHRRLKVLS